MDINKYKLLLKYSKRLKVLYVEDNEDVRIQVKVLLDNYFDFITIAVDGIDGLEKFKLDSYDIVFTDIEMPNMDGIEMLKQITKLDKNISTAVFSAYSDTEYLLNSISIGVDGYVVKPLDLQHLNEVIQRIVDKLKLSDKNTNTIQLQGGYSWNKTSNTLYKDSCEIHLSKNELALLKLLGMSPLAIYSAVDIENELFDDDKHDNKRIRNLISRLKIKLNIELINSIYGHGYKLNIIN